MLDTIEARCVILRISSSTIIVEENCSCFMSFHTEYVHEQSFYLRSFPDSSEIFHTFLLNQLNEWRIEVNERSEFS